MAIVAFAATHNCPRSCSCIHFLCVLRSTLLHLMRFSLLLLCLFAGFFNVKSVPIEIYTHSKCKPTSIRGIFNSPSVDKKRFRMKNGRKNPPKHTDKPHNLNVVQQRRSESRWYGYGNSDNINGICLTGWLVCTRDYSIKSVSSKREHWNSRKSLPILLFPCTMNQHHHHHRHLLCTGSVAFMVIHPHNIHIRQSRALDFRTERMCIQLFAFGFLCAMHTHR